MLGKKKLPLEDVENLLELIEDDNYKTMLKYVELMHKMNETDFLNVANDKDVLLYEKGVVDGSKKLLAMVLNFKAWLKSEAKQINE